MKTTVELYDPVLPNRDMSCKIAVVDKLTLFLHQIDERKKEVAFVAMPNITNYGTIASVPVPFGTAKSQGVEFESIPETEWVRLKPGDAPWPLTVDSTVYHVSVDSIEPVPSEGSDSHMVATFSITW